MLNATNINVQVIITVFCFFESTSRESNYGTKTGLNVSHHQICTWAYGVYNVDKLQNIP